MIIKDASDYAMETFKLGNVTVLHPSDDKVFTFVQAKSIPLHIWILLKFQKTVINSDSETHHGIEYKTVIYAKRLFGKIYIMKEEKYINGKLVSYGKLHRVEKIIRGFSAKMWTEKFPNPNQDQGQ